MRKFKNFYLVFIMLGIFTAAGTSAYGEILFPDNSMVKQKCSACHKPDPQGKLDVIEETRKTTEEWKVVVDRMIRLNSAPLEDEDFYPVIKELSDKLCLSPLENSAVAYLNSDENSQYREIPKNDLEQRIYTACVRCHTFAKIGSHRMTPAQWSENRNLHLGYYPTVVPQMREMDWPKESKDLIEPLAKLYPFDNAEWKKWMEQRQDQELSGEWTIAGYQPGLGYYQGAYTLSKRLDKGEDEYLIEKKIRYENGTVLNMKGEATLFSQYHLRYALAPTPLTGRIEGVFDLDAETMGFSGKWWTVVQDSNAYGNESFYKKEGSPRIIASFPQALRKGTGKEQALTLVGVNLPQNLSEANIKFSDSNISVTKITHADTSKVICTLMLGDEVATGGIDLNLKGVALTGVLKVFDSIDAITISPRIGRARVSCGAAYPPHGVQFVARGIDFGLDGKLGTEDDLVLEPVNATWWLEEEKTREDDDDMKYVNAPITNGLYTPVSTYGPIKERKQNREGVGLIAVGASFNDNGKILKDRVRLAVTVPDFVTFLK